jgi:uncharacterized cupin superfamily protein
MSEIDRDLIRNAKTTSELKLSPIEPSWIIEGNPIAQASLISKSSDGLSWTMVWECSGGKFHWYYDIDESILVLEGSVVIESDTIPPTRYGPGDIIIFRNDDHARWHVERRVRKLAFCRKVPPVWIGFGLRALSKIKRTIMPSRKRSTLGLMSS